jgi:hypothetical protein
MRTSTYNQWAPTGGAEKGEGTLLSQGSVGGST